MIVSLGLRVSCEERGHRMRTARLWSLWICLSVLTACGGKHMASTSDGSMQVVVTDGSVRVSTGFNSCPASVVVTASPPVTRVAGRIAVAVRATDEDTTDLLSYAWTSTVGSFADATASHTIYTCPGPDRAGPTTLTVTVSDGTCSIKQSLNVSCYSLADAGLSDGIDAPSQQDGGGRGVGGSADGGAGAVGGRGGTNGAGGGGGACTGDLTACEGTLCNQCTFGVVAGQPDLCSGTTESCFNCDPVVVGCNAPTLVSDAQRTACQNLYLCMRDRSCANPSDSTDLTPCYCGSAAREDCLVGKAPPNGMCLQQVIDAAGSSDPAVINQRFIDPNYPLGAAMNLASCRASFCGRSSDPIHPSCPAW
jgi:hypothetical protein